MVEPLAVCNLRCPLCPTGVGLSNLTKKPFPLEQFKRLVLEFHGSLKLISLNHWGEPFLHPDLFEMAAFAQRRGIHVFTSTNLNHFSKTMARELVRSRIAGVQVSLDGATQGSYQIYRDGGNLRKVLKHVIWINREKRRQRSDRPILAWQFLVFRHNESEVKKAQAMAKRLGMEFKLRIGNVRLAPRGGWGFGRRVNWIPMNPQYSEENHLKQRMSYDLCRSLWFGPAINPDGTVFPCCVINDSRYSFGNVFEQDFSAIWNNRKFRLARGIVSGRRKNVRDEDIPCLKCRYNPYLESSAGSAEWHALAQSES